MNAQGKRRPDGMAAAALQLDVITKAILVECQRLGLGSVLAKRLADGVIHWLVYDEPMPIPCGFCGRGHGIGQCDSTATATFDGLDRWLPPEGS